ncbi:hypothetical protein E8E13_002345 [Curvularia kusanoi]|uniref:C3H1-type domain-containing protein n=1 Tax=Curvularia kusanoi TaxID=90978 RepID=A0A9P4TE47_CURKU|nr:hypothetical protein E8E13_002345 [Curvularia kusanoi]
MTSFKFPPPPPPPPKAATTDAQPSYSSQRGGPSRGRGNDRGRGGDRGRGRGGHSRGGYNHGQGNGNAHGGRGGARGGFGNNRGGNTHHPRQSVPSSMPSISNGSPSQTNQPQMDPQAFAQAMSFMATPAGMQSMAAFATHMSSATNGALQYPQSVPPTQVQAAPQYSPGQQAGQKRKRPEHHANAPPLPQKKSQSGPKPPRAKAAPPPPVPSFGFSLPTPAAPSSRPSNKGDQKKRVNLGLSAQNAMDESSSEEEDVDEEAVFADKVKVEGIAFEHNGEMISLQTAADVQAYIKDRRRNYPTQQRVLEKAQEAAARREHELEFLHRVKGKPTKPAADPRPAKSKQPSKVDEKAKEETNKKREELAALRKKLHESWTQKPSQPTNLLGAGYESDSGSDAASSILSESSVVSSSEESADSDSDEEEREEEGSDSDAAPETTSSKVAPPTVKVPPPAPVSAPPSQVCKNWSKSGKCKFGKGCRWAHPPQEKGSGREKVEKRMGLFEKMVEQELEKADRMALDAIKYLGQHGFLG